ncbi:hypothetical protein [Actinophytocola sp. KF-1]
MRTWWSRAGGVVAAAVVLFGSAPVAGAEGAEVVIEPGEIAVVNGTGEFLLVNHSATAAEVTLDGTVAWAGTRRPVTFEVGGKSGNGPFTAKVDGYGSVPVALTVERDVPDEASGVVTLVTDPAGSARHAAVSFAAGSPTGEVTTRSLGLSGPVDVPVVPQRPVRLSVPIAASTCPGDWSAPVVLQSGSDSTTATARCDGRDATELEITSDAPPPAYGTYTGAIELGGSDVTITVTTAAGWVWAVVITLLGLVAGLVQRGYLINRRPISRLITKAKAVTMAGRRADATVKRDFPPVGHVLGPSAEREADALAERAADVQKRHPGLLGFFAHPADDDVLTVESITKDVTAAEDAIAAWRTRAPGVLKRLSTTVDEQRANASSHAPVLLEHADELLSPGGTNELELRSVPGFLADAEATQAALALLPTVLQLAAALDARRADLPEYRTWQQIWFAESRALADEVIEALGKAASGRDLVAADLDRTLEQARRIALRLPAPSGTTSTGSRVRTIGVTLVPTVPAAGVAVFDRVRAMLGSTPDEIVRRTRNTDRWLLFVAAVLAVWSGLAAWYIDKSWGTGVDLVTTFLWGAAAGVVAGPLSDAVERVTQNAADRRAPASS